MKDSTLLTKISLFVVGIIVIIFGWMIISKTSQNQFLFPTWEKIFSAIGDFFTNKTCNGVTSCDSSFAIYYSLFRVIMTIVVSLITTLIFGYLYYLYEPLGSFFKPFIIFLKAAPIAIISVYFWYAFDNVISVYLVTYFVVSPLMKEGIMTSIDNMDLGIKNELSLTNTSTFNKYIKVVIPIILPYILMNILQSFGLGFKVVVMAEYLCQSKNGLGRWIYNYQSLVDYSYLLGLLLIIVVVVIIFEVIIKRLQKKIIKAYQLS